MAEPKFTPGPWEVEIEDSPEIEICADIRLDGDYISIAMVDGVDNFKRGKANANLIAAAPDLYEALEAYDKAEADILANANWYTESGVPQITQEQFDRLVDCQTLKAKALRKARGEE